MDHRICVIVPVHNGELTLRDRIQILLEMTSELTDQFQIRIIDDSSDDNTFDVAKSLSIEFPQVMTIQNPQRLGITETFEQEMAKVDADTVFLHDIAKPFSSTAFHDLWNSVQTTALGQTTNGRQNLQADRISFVHTEHGLQVVKSRKSKRPKRNAKPHSAAPIISDASTSELIQQLSEILEAR